MASPRSTSSWGHQPSRRVPSDSCSIARKPLPSPPATEVQALKSPYRHVSLSAALRPATPILNSLRGVTSPPHEDIKQTEARVSEASVREDTQPHHPKHPPKPITPGWKRPNDVLTVLIGLLLPLPFYALAIYVARRDGQDANDDEFASIFTAMKLTVSIFPVAYALVVGRAVSSVAAYKLEKTSRLGTLERLMGSLSLGSTITTILSLGVFHSVTPLVLVLWAVSPIGGQSAINIVSIEAVPVFGELPVPYFSTEGTTLFQSGDPGFQSELNAIYAASVFAPPSIRESPMDLWGNVKIPYLSAISKQSAPDSDGWYSVGNNTHNSLQYSSLIGIPVLATMTESDNTTMSILSSYLEFDCEPLRVGDDGITVESFDPITEFTNGTWYSTVNDNNTFLIAINGMNNVTFAPWIQTNFIKNITLNQQQQWKLLFHAGPEGSSDWGYTQCAISTEYVESSVVCAGKACSVDRIRQSTAPHPNPWNTDLACAFTFMWFTKNFLPALGTHPSSVHAGASGPAEMYLATGSVAGVWGLGSGGFTFDGSAVSSTADFSARLGHLINTYWHASYEPEAFHGNTSALVRYDDPSTWEDRKNFDAAPRALRHAVGQTSHSRRVYAVHRAWLAVYIVAVSTMFLAALLSAFLLAHARGPRILGSVAGLLRDTRYADLPVHLRDSTANWDELARAGKNLRLGLVDVQPQASRGHISIGLCERGSSLLGTKSKGRFYD